TAWSDVVKADPHLTFFVGQAGPTTLLRRLRQEHVPFSRVIRGRIQRGVSPDVVAAHVTSESEARAADLEGELLRPSISGSQIGRYRPWSSDQIIIYTTRHTVLSEYPKAGKYLRQFRPMNTCKEVRSGKHPWWSLHRSREREIFESPKFIGLTT